MTNARWRDVDAGYTETAAVAQGLAEGIAFLAKPFTPASLLRKVHEILPGARASPRS